MFLERGKGPSGRVPGVTAPPRPEPDVACAGDSEQEVVRGSGLGSVAGVGEGGAARYTRGHRGVSVRSLNQPAARARAPEPSPADRRYVLKREGIPDAGCYIGSLRGCGLGVQNGLHLMEARWLPASASAAGVSGTLSPPKFGKGENGGRGREKGEGCNKVFPDSLGFRSGGCRGAKGCCGGGILFSGKMV